MKWVIYLYIFYPQMNNRGRRLSVGEKYGHYCYFVVDLHYSTIILYKICVYEEY